MATLANSIVGYELKKRYPGSPEPGTIKGTLDIPGHQWPEFYRPVTHAEMQLRQKKADLLKQVNALTDQIQAYIDTSA